MAKLLSVPSAPRFSGWAPHFLLAAGGVFLLAGLWLSPTRIETAVFGVAGERLAWGPALFRGLLLFHGALALVAAWQWDRLRRWNALGEKSPLGVGVPSSHVWGLALLTVVGLALRLYRLDTCLWFDEIATVVDFGRPPLLEALTSFPSQNQHMLYTLLMRVPMAIWGEASWTARLPAAFFGAATIVPLYLLGRKALSASEGLFAAAFLTFSYHHIWFSQNARGYSGALLFSITSTWAWLEARSSRRPSAWLLYAAQVFLGLWVHPTLVFVIAAHGLVWLVAVFREADVSWREKAGYPVAAWLLAASCTLQVYAPALPDFFASALHEVSLETKWINPLWMLAETARSLQVGLAGGAVLAVALALGAWGWLTFFRRYAEAAVLMILPGLLTAGVILTMGHNMWPRTFFYCAGFALLVLANGAFTVPRQVLSRIRAIPEPWALAAGPVALGLLLLTSLAAIPRCYDPPKQDFLGARDFVEERRAAGEEAVAVGLAGFAYKRLYAPEWLAADSEEELASVERTAAGVWLVYTIPIQLEAWHPEIWTIVQRDYEIVRVFPGTLGSGEVYVCRRKAVLGASPLDTESEARPFLSAAGAGALLTVAAIPLVP